MLEKLKPVTEPFYRLRLTVTVTWWLWALAIELSYKPFRLLSVVLIAFTVLTWRDWGEGDNKEFARFCLICSLLIGIAGLITTIIFVHDI